MFFFFTTPILNQTKISENINELKVVRSMLGQARVDRFFGECNVRLDSKN